MWVSTATPTSGCGAWRVTRYVYCDHCRLSVCLTFYRDFQNSDWALWGEHVRKGGTL